MSDSDLTPPPPPDPPQAPPPTAPPPSPPPSGPSGGTVQIGDWFTASWELIKPVWLEYVIAFLIFEIVIGIASMLCVLPGLLIAGPMFGGLFVYAAKRMEGQSVEITDIFKGFDRFLDLFLVGLAILMIPMLIALVMWLPTMLAVVGMGSAGASEDAIGAVGGLSSCFGCLGMLVLILYPVFAGAFFIFSYPLVLFKKMSAIDALKASFEIVKPKFVSFLALLVACWVIVFVASFVGSLLFFIGTLILTPLAWSIVITMQLMAYREFVGLTSEELAPYR